MSRAFTPMLGDDPRAPAAIRRGEAVVVIWGTGWGLSWADWPRFPCDCGEPVECYLIPEPTPLAADDYSEHWRCTKCGTTAEAGQ